MEFNIRLTSRKCLDITEKEESKNKNPEKEDVTNSPDVVVPEDKPTTASVKDVLKALAANELEMVSTTETTPKIKDGVTKFLYKNSNVTTYKRNGLWGVEINGSVDFNTMLNKIPELKELETPKAPQGADGSNGIDGDVDDGFSQGNTGDCWVLTGTLALASTEVGKQIIKNSITVNEDGSVTVNFKGVGVSYTISADEIAAHDTDNNTSDAYSNGDNDMLVIELAVAKLVKDIANGKVKLDVDPESYEGYYNKNGSIEGGFGQTLIYYLTGQSADTRAVDSSSQRVLAKGLSKDEVLDVLQKAYETGNTALAFGVYYSPHEGTLIDGTPYSLNISGGHALAITNLTENTVTFVNPWDSTTEYTMTWDEFAGLGIGMISATDLTDLVGEVDVDNGDDVPPVNPDDNGDDVPPVNPDDNGDDVPPVNPDDNGDDVPPVNPDDNDDDVPPVNPDDNDDDVDVDGGEDVDIDGPDDVDGPDEPDGPKDFVRIYNGYQLTSLGFTKSEIDKYFDMHNGTGVSKFKIGINTFAEYSLKEGITLPWYDGEIKTAEDLANVLGLQSRKNLMNQGLTEEVINKFFSLRPNKSLNNADQAPVYEYQLNSEYTKCFILSNNKGETLLQMFREDGSATCVTIRRDGSYTVNEVEPENPDDSEQIDEYNFIKNFKPISPNSPSKIDSIFINIKATDFVNKFGK